ncbi:MAG TPA: hypothetical protein PKL69_13535 [Agitococcus sp.]|nr:hypothetical protein [Agitococcus sp.]HNA21249.1 hypothetical protein [Agitococcus sp.]HNC02548.1 hypothetical protein [Agitococcus sp.]HNI62367.1 hypothetical protein [Agitococcus sp.]HNJ87707.1 hypothetical protein [Agitococcus sp.]
MGTVTIKANNQTLTLSSDDTVALEKALIQAKKAPNQDIQQMTNSGIMLVTFMPDARANFSRSIKPTDAILSPEQKPFFTAKEVVQTDC